MSLFIANLAFPDNMHIVNNTKLGVILGSLLSAVIGYMLLSFSIKFKQSESNSLQSQ